jgi:hypothetical protein
MPTSSIAIWMSGDDLSGFRCLVQSPRHSRTLALEFRPLDRGGCLDPTSANLRPDGARQIGAGSRRASDAGQLIEKVSNARFLGDTSKDIAGNR